jgi:hypothetical protein
MKPCTIVFTLLLALISFSTARAENVEALKIHADYFPDRNYAIGLDLDANHLIHQIYFQDENGTDNYFSVSELSEFTPIFSVAGITFVRIRIASQPTPDSAVIEMSYTLNYLRGTHQSLFFNVGYNRVSNQYEITDARNNQVIHEAIVHTRYSLVVPIGISSVDTQ